LAPHGITVNTILPGAIQTSRLDAIFQGRANRSGLTIDEVRCAAIAQIPTGRLGHPSEIAAAALFLASPAGSYVTGVNLAVDGGRTAVQS
jgi:3-oxoacyl-[acyl-carrier protein] reductase